MEGGSGFAGRGNRLSNHVARMPLPNSKSSAAATLVYALAEGGAAVATAAEVGAGLGLTV